MLDFALRQPRAIIEDLSRASDVPASARTMLDSTLEADFIRESQQIARSLYRSQTANSPSGILIVAIVESGNDKSVLILKAEHQEGMRLRRDPADQGRFDLEHLDELIVGNNSRVYKIALLSVRNGTILGKMVDQQNGVAFADFFLGSFLGCSLADDAELQTKQFMDSALHFVNNDVSDPELKARYAGALISYMQTPAENFQASQFADQFLEVDDRDDFIRSLPAAVANNVIPKNMSLVSGRGTGLRVYGNGVLISANARAVEDGAFSLRYDDAADITHVEIRGDMRRYGIGSGPKS